MEMERSMIAAKHLPNEYWGEAITTIVYIMNPCPTKSVKKRVPQEAWTGMNHSVSQLNFFGCVSLHLLVAHSPPSMFSQLEVDTFLY